jgi:hypothetical protein
LNHGNARKVKVATKGCTFLTTDFPDCADRTSKADTTLTSDAGVITPFQNGALVVNFDNLSALSIAAYPDLGTAGPIVPAGNQLSSNV